MDNSMTKTEALKALANGEKVTHSTFAYGEYIMLADAYNYMDEDKMLIPTKYFWAFRQIGIWETGWRTV